MMNDDIDHHNARISTAGFGGYSDGFRDVNAACTEWLRNRGLIVTMREIMCNIYGNAKSNRKDLPPEIEPQNQNENL